MFKETYVRSLEGIRASIASGEIDPSAFDTIDRSPTRSCPDDVWEKLSAPQRAARWLSAWQKAVHTGRYSMADDEYLRAAVAGSSLEEESVAITTALCRNSTHLSSNRTLAALARRVNESVCNSEPLQLWVSQCLDKGAEMMHLHNEYRLGRVSGGERSPTVFSDGVKLTAWEQLKQLLTAIEYPARVTMLLGDMDYFTVFELHSWCPERALPAFSAEMLARKMEVQEKADAYFGAGRVQVRLWSELYKAGDFEEARARAMNPDAWADYEGLMSSSAKMYLEQWGLAAWGRMEGLTAADLRTIVEAEITRTVAQYRLESHIVADCGGIQLWAERVPAPAWPISISNYDGAREVPSLLLV